MTKVLFVNRYFYPDYSGTSQMLSDLVFSLARDGLPVHVITSRQRYDDANARLAGREEINGVRVHRVWTSRFGRAHLPGRALDYLSFYLTAGWRLLWLVSREDVIVAKTDPPLMSVIAASVTSVRRGRLINWLQDLFPEVAVALGIRGVGGPVGGTLKRLRDRSLHHAIRNIVVGERMRERIIASGVVANRLLVIPNWADGQSIRPVSHADNPLRDGWKLGNRFVVAYSGNMGRAHEFDTVLKAAALLSTRADIVFLFVGGGARRPWLEAQVRAQGLESQIVFRPYQPREQLSESLSVADVHLVSLKPELEGCMVPSKLYGILAVGRPVLFVGDPAGEVARIVAESRCGYSVASGDADSLAERITELADDSVAREALGQRARMALEARFERSIACARWKELIESLVLEGMPVGESKSRGQ